MINRRQIMQATLATGILSGMGLGGARAQTRSLVFDAKNYTELTKTIQTARGDRVVAYRFYKAIPYVSAPVDIAYQSLNISVPVSIDGKPVDNSASPILFSNSVGGYMPSSVAEATGVGGAPMRGLPPMGMQPPPQAAPLTGIGAEVQSGGNAMIAGGKRVSNADLALAAGMTVVEPGARGRTLTDAAGIYYGVAPAAIVDLKAAVKYVRFNKGRIPGDTDRIVSSGTSAGGALSALLGASGDSPLFAPYLEEIGAADASDAIFAVGSWCPITDLEHADMAYEWNWGTNPLSRGSAVDQNLSAQLKSGFAAYQSSLKLRGLGGFGPLTSANYADYLLKTYLQPAATHYMSKLSSEDRAAYLAKNPHIRWKSGKASFGWSDYISHVGARKKGLPAFDTFDLSAGENNLFGRDKTKARHFTAFSQKHVTGAPAIDADIPALLNLMNPMFFIGKSDVSTAKHWWIRVGTKDTDTSLSVVANLSAALNANKCTVNSKMYWDAGHGANEDANAFINWFASVRR